WNRETVEVLAHDPRVDDAVRQAARRLIAAQRTGSDAEPMADALWSELDRLADRRRSAVRARLQAIEELSTLSNAEPLARWLSSPSRELDLRRLPSASVREAIARLADDLEFAGDETGAAALRSAYTDEMVPALSAAELAREWRDAEVALARSRTVGTVAHHRDPALAQGGADLREGGEADSPDSPSDPNAKDTDPTPFETGFTPSVAGSASAAEWEDSTGLDWIELMTRSEFEPRWLPVVDRYREALRREAMR
ncbi:MAG: hypothetical protein KDC38_19315, partial [Planctomycetes bacterium]|nr:hypothetical protein [Planctomycetota bacterium]